MNGALQWVLLALGLFVLLTRDRSSAILLVALQAVLLGAGALLLAPTRPFSFAIAGIVLLARGIPLFVLLAYSVRRTRERHPVGLQTRPLVNAGLAVATALVAIALLPPLGLESPTAAYASVAMLATGVVIVITRRETIVQALGLLVAENGVALAAVAVPGGLPLVVELGVAIDLIVVTAVAVILHERIFEEFGIGDTHRLRSLRD